MRKLYLVARLDLQHLGRVRMVHIRPAAVDALALEVEAGVVVPARGVWVGRLDEGLALVADVPRWLLPYAVVREAHKGHCEGQRAEGWRRVGAIRSQWTREDAAASSKTYVLGAIVGALDCGRELCESMEGGWVLCWILFAVYSTRGPRSSLQPHRSATIQMTA